MEDVIGSAAGGERLRTHVPFFDDLLRYLCCADSLSVPLRSSRLLLRRAPLVSSFAALLAFHTARGRQLLLLLNPVLLSPLVL
jgi:hypothetical protein